jgi:hypothetical protein
VIVNRHTLLLLLLVPLIACSQQQDQKEQKDEKKPEPKKVRQAPGWDQPAFMCNLHDERINESSGIAASWLRKDFYFTHNDSGDGPRFFRFNQAGDVLDVFELKGAKAEDWEDMASVKLKDTSYLYFGDIGDNAEKRTSILVYRVREPEPGASSQLTDFDTYTIKYPDGPHNAEALMVNPRNGDIYIVTKTMKADSQVFKLAAPKGSGDYKMKEVGKLKLKNALVTAADVSADGERVIIRTYGAAYEFRWKTKFDDWPKSKPIELLTANETQAEAICYMTDGRTLVTTSEGMPCPVSVIRRKA